MEVLNREHSHIKESLHFVQDDGVMIYKLSKYDFALNLPLDKNILDRLY